MSRFLVGLVAAVVLAVIPASAFGQDSEVSVGSPSSPFPQNKQNEPDVAIDAANPMVVAAGANDEIDLAPCDGSSCPFTQGVGVSGVYLSFDGGVTWRQPNYTGYSARDGSPGTGPIGTLPNYAEVGLVSNGDPALAFGPRRGANGRFSYGNGTRLYYANIATNFSAVRSEAGIRGQGAIAVSHTDSPQAAAVDGANGAWSAPVLASQRQSTTTFADKEDLTADNAATSSYFGNVYVCFTQFRSNGGTAQPIQVATSRDGGESFGLQRQITASAGNLRQFGRQGCSMKTDSHGVLYVFFEGTEKKVPSQMLARSFDGGRSFERPRAISTVTDCGALDVVGRGDLNLDGQAGARNSSFPLADVANGAPSGVNAPDTIAAGWCDGRKGLNHEHARVVVSANGGGTFAASNEEQPGDRPGYVSLALAPDGTDLYLTYDAFLDPFQDTTAPPRRMQGVVRHADLAGVATSNAATLHRGMVGDARGSSANSLTNEFLGDYTGVAATDDGAVAVWNDVREATVCTAINDYRQSLIDGNPIAKPAPNTACLPGFGNLDIFGIAVPDPTP